MRKKLAYWLAVCVAFTGLNALPASPAAAIGTGTLLPECPLVLMSKCSFDPAAYHNNNPADPTDYGNYDLAERPADGTRIKGVTIHDIEGTCEAAVTPART